MATRAVETAAVRVRVDVRGAVQGVGFRPFVHARATARGLAGWAANSAEGLCLEVEGPAAAVTELVAELERSPPPHAIVTGVETRRIAPRRDTGFEIRASRAQGAGTAHVLPDIATCDDCLRELFDPADRRYGYPFVNCTHCGPRFSIVERLPYDRERTSMKRFPLCAACRAEYEDPADRRFHAEPNACRVCGPELRLHDASGCELERGAEAFAGAVERLRAGGIVAVKGLGGYHLFVDARDAAAVARLRERKQRPEKPFAVMFPTPAEVERSCHVTRVEADWLDGAVRPIVLVARRAVTGLAEAVAPGQPRIGAMLPYTPLHHLLMDALGFPVVATSGNVGGEPIATGEPEAFERLAAIADTFLAHDRPIVRAVDDSVVRVVGGRELVLRSARGFAPARVASVPGRAPIAALGGHLKTSIALTHAGGLVMSQHIGNLDTVAARAAHGRTLSDLAKLHGVEAATVACDLHPDYASQGAAAAARGSSMRVQHHLAHVAACVAEHGLELPVLGAAFDGAGFGLDATLWGGEFIVLGARGWHRVASLRGFPLPGGEAAQREPRRAALGLLFEAYGEAALGRTELPPVAAFAPHERDVLRTMLMRGVNAPRTSSVGRLFDAFAALAGLRQRASFEGQAAAELEGAAERVTDARVYPLPVRASGDGRPAWVVDWQPALEAALADLDQGPSTIAAGLHAGLARAIADVAACVGESRVVLTGGCFQNALLTEAAVEALRGAGFEPHWHRRIPPNDGGLAVGQAAWAAMSARQSEDRQCV